MKDRQIRISLLEKARLIYENHGFEHLTVSKRVENLAPEGWDRGTSCLHILRSLYGVDWEERVKVSITTKNVSRLNHSSNTDFTLPHFSTMQIK